MKRTIAPGGTIGVLGSGQLGRMFTIAARRLGYRVHVLSPDNDTPTGQVADVEFRADYDDLETVARFAQGVDVVTFEFENVPVAAMETVDRHVPVRPGGHVLYTTQNRLREKGFVHAAGLPVTPFQAIGSLNDLRAAATSLLPGVLKTAAWGYDGKGQVTLNGPDDVATAWETLSTDQAILEKFVDFECELSVVGARGQDGSFVHYGPMVNDHQNHILDLSIAPSDLPGELKRHAIEITRGVFEQLNVTGVLCVEYFLTRDGKLLINELAPRPHNSGHLTIDAHVTCQFEQQVRAVCGLPLGSNRQLSPAAMVNLLGDCWHAGRPDWSAVAEHPDVKIHLYGKRSPRPGRKMGHLTALASTAQLATRWALECRRPLLPLSARDDATGRGAARTPGIGRDDSTELADFPA